MSIFEAGKSKPHIAYAASLRFDRRLYRQDIAGSIAHARMLAQQGIISPKDAELIVMGLGAIRREIEAGTFPWREDLEDVHINIEARLHDLIGETAGRLHTARSRNDQVATDMRLYAKEVIGETLRRVRALQGVILQKAEAHTETVLPGYTHLQRAQPVVLAHHLLAYFWMLERDAQRFRQAYERTDALPLGSGALAGVPYPVDRQFVARELGFSRISENSMDAVSDRDFFVDYLSAAALCMVHLSRLAEELVIWSSEEFGFIRLAEAYTTGSSIMPQKRNPVFAELMRGKVGRVVGHLVGLLIVLKGLPLTYNSDLQEDKEGFFDTVDTLLPSLEVMTAMLQGMEVNTERMRQAAEGGTLLATDFADYLVRKGMPFRQAHTLVAEICRYALAQGKGLRDVTVEELRRFSPLFAEDVLRLDALASVHARAVPGGTAPAQVRAQWEHARRCWEQGKATDPVAEK
ncbi:MAG: argininosuccinate lyase [Dehalococcoidia bacterium]|nr:argininosuccinate lyase [Dehalococcoidia bacterium]MDW8119398.1 argininosuccinate lyase [Chloroflexota bacterium]